jgi:hypothetical protein
MSPLQCMRYNVAATMSPSQISIHFDRFRHISTDFDTFRQILHISTDFDRFWQISSDFDKFLQISSDFDRFWRISSDFDTFWQILKYFNRFLQISTDFEISTDFFTFRHARTYSPLQCRRYNVATTMSPLQCPKTLSRDIIPRHYLASWYRDINPRLSQIDSIVWTVKLS